jgi:hypothetical protein
VDLAPDPLIPDVSTPQLALVEPDFNHGSAECFANPLGSLSILGGIAKKYRVRRLAYDGTTL